MTEEKFEKFPLSEYEDGYLKIGLTKILCTWETVSATFIENLEKPSLLDLLALE